MFRVPHSVLTLPLVALSMQWACTSPGPGGAANPTDARTQPDSRTDVAGASGGGAATGGTGGGAASGGAGGGGLDASTNSDVAPVDTASTDVGSTDAPADMTVADSNAGRDVPAVMDAGSPTDADAAAANDAGAPGAIVSTTDIADVFSGHPVPFALVTHGDQQFVAFYDKNQKMTAAQRTLNSTTWTFATLPSTVGWDSHNYIAMGIDSAGFIHISGNMHASPLVYFRTTAPLDVSTFQQVGSMVGSNEQSCTYPQFIQGPADEFIYAYRDGTSGDGNYIFNVYDVPTKKWRRLLNTPLADGQGLRNAYPVGPTLGPDGWWHLVYVWRETSNASSNHDLSYAKSQDLVNWQTGTGKALTLPITLATSDIVDPVPQNGGIINNNTLVGFDSQNRPIVAYHKFDSAGNTQLFNARVESGRWVTHQASNWNYRWAIGGTGTLVFQIRVLGARPDTTGSLVQPWYHMQLGGWNAFRLDEATLTTTATIGRTLPYPASLERVESSTAGMGVRWATDSGTSPDPSILYMLRWETLAENQDQPRATVPPPTRLRVYGFRK